MANVTIRDLPQGTTPAEVDQFVYNDDGVDKRITRSDFEDSLDVTSSSITTATGTQTVQEMADDRAVRVGSAAELRALEPLRDDQQAILLGHTVKGIGGGIFYYDQSDTVTTDNKVTVFVTPGGARWKRKIEHPWYDPAWAGAIDDGLSSKSDSRQAILDTFAALPSSGGMVRLTSSGKYDASYYVSDSLSINKSNCILWVDQDVELFCDANTTDGHTFAFLNPTIGSQNSNCHVMGMGAIRNTAPGTNENAIGFARISNYSCVGMRVPAANKKAITAQVDCDNGYIARNIIGTTGNDAIAVEGDSTGGTEENFACTILDNIIENAGEKGVNVTFVAGPSSKKIVTGGNVVKLSGDHGFAFSGCDRLYHRGGDEVLDSGSRGVSYLNCNDICGNIASHKSFNQSVFFDSCGGDIQVDLVAKSASFGQSNAADAVVVQNPQSTHELGIYVSGSAHKSVLNSITASTYPVLLVRPKIINDGVTDRYLGTVPFVDEGNRETRETFVDGDATPDISKGHIFTAANSASTTITTLDRPYTEKQVEVFFTTSNTTISHGGVGGFRLKGAVDATPPVGGLMVFRYTSGVWYEISRSF